MRRFRNLLLVGCLLASVGVQAFQKKGLNEVCVFHTPATEFYGSATFSLKPDSEWFCELGNDIVLEVIHWNPKTSGDYWDPLTQYRLFMRNNDGKYELIADKKITGKTDYTAVKLFQTDKRLIFFAPGGINIFDDLMTPPQALMPSSTIKVYAKSEKQLVKALNNLVAYPSRHSVDLGAFEDVLNNPDPTSPIGEWNYLDRVTPKDHHVVIGGQYSLAVIPHDETPGSYLLIYIGGADENRSFWEPGDIKGVLTPTAFENHYDLEWYDAHRLPAVFGECSATFEGQNLLTLDFPLLGSQIRFQRFLSPH